MQGCPTINNWPEEFCLRSIYLISQISPVFSSGHGDTSHNFREVKRKIEEKLHLVKALKYRKESLLSPTNLKNGLTSFPVGHQ